MWFNILKRSSDAPNVKGDVTEDIDFDNAIRAFGFYSAESKSPSRLNPEVIGRRKGKSKITYKDVMNEKIRINPKMCHDYLVQKLGIPPSDKQLIEYITKVIMHEATHAGMAEEQMNMTTSQAEYGAYIGQFPNSPYLALKQWLNHPATQTDLIDTELQQLLGISARMDNPSVEKVRELINFVGGITARMPNNQATFDLRDKIVALEGLARKSGQGKLIGEIDFNDPKIMADRWGTDAFNEVRDAVKESYIGEDKEKMVGAVTSTTAGMESRPRYSRKKEDEN
jgi:hypothetical protein